MKASPWLILVFLLLASLASSSVMAAPIQTIALNCGFTSATAVDCTDSVILQCTAVTTLAGGALSPAAITQMYATINGDQVLMSLYSGTVYNGTWRTASQVVGSNYPKEATISFEGVTVADKSGFTCYSTPEADSEGCPLATGTVLLENNCECAYVEVRGAITPDNRQQLNLTPEAGCSGVSRSSYVWADYCDPDWIPVYGSCDGAWDGVESATGLTTKSYVKRNQLCCSQTQSYAGHLDFNHGGGSDCDPPLDNGNEFVCALDVWPNYQDTIYEEGGDKRKGGFTYDDYTTYNEGDLNFSIQPLIFDMDRDGVVDIITLDEDDGFLKIYDSHMSLLTELVYSGIATSVSQPALWGVSDLGGDNSDEGYVMDISVIQLNQSPLIVVPYNVGSQAWIKVYNVTGGDLYLFQTVSLGALGSISGVSCYFGYCYFMTGDGYMHKLNPLTGSVTTSSFYYPFAAGSNTTWYSGNGTLDRKMVPTFFWDGSLRVLWWWKGTHTGGSPGFYDYTDITIVLTDDSFYPRRMYGIFASDSDHDPEINFDTSNIVVTGDYGSVTFQQTIGNMSGYNLATFLISSASGHEFVDSKLIWYGYSRTGDCLSNPVELDCMGDGGQDIGVMYNVLSSDLSSTIGQEFSAPTIYRSFPILPPSSGTFSTFVNSDGSMFAAADSDSVDIYRTADGLKVKTISWPASGFVPYSVYFDDDYDKLYIGFIFGTTYWLKIYDYSSLYAITEVFSSGTSSSYSQRGPIQIFDDDYVIMPLLRTSGVGTRIIKRNNVTQQWSMPGISGGATLLYVDNDLDIMFMSGVGYYVPNASSYVNVSSPANFPSGATYPGTPSIYNFQPSSIKFLDQSSTPHLMTGVLGSMVTTSAACDLNFYPMYWNADNYILGINSVTHKFQVCDFSDPFIPMTRNLTLTWNGVVPYNYPSVVRRAGSSPYAYLGGYSGTTGYVYRLDADRSNASISVDSSYGRALCIDPVSAATGSYLTKKREVTVPFGAGCGPITKDDIDADGYEDIISIGGIASMGTGQWLTTFLSRGSYPDSWVVPTDLDGNYRTDLVYSSASERVLQSLISNVLLESVSYSSTPVLDAIRCTARNGSNVVTVQVSGKMPSPEDTEVWITANGKTTKYDRAAGPNFDIRFDSAGTYSIVAKLVQNYPAYLETSSQSCSVTIVLEEEDFCSLGEDGEFDFVDFIGNHGWLGTGSTKSPSSGMITLAVNDAVTYSLDSCDEYSALTVRERLNAASQSRMTLKDVEGNIIAGFIVDLGTVYDLSGNPVASVTPDSMIIVDVELDAVTNKVNWYVNGEVKASIDKTFVTLGSVTITGPGAVDYVRVLKSGTIIGGGGTTVPSEGVIQELDGDFSFLSGCNASLNEDSDLSVRMSYPALARYCASRPDSAYCDYDQLRKVILYNQGCWKEAYNYCVRVTYGQTQGNINSADNLQGGTVCMSVLGLSSGFEGIVKPTVEIGWEIFTSNTMVILVLIILIIVATVVMRKR